MYFVTILCFKKVGHFYFYYNFGKSSPTFIGVSMLNSKINLRYSWN